MIEAYQLSQRAACRLVGISRTAYRYCAKPRCDEDLRQRMKALAAERSSYGYLFLHALLKQEGLVINKKRTDRVYCVEKLQVRSKPRKKTTATQAATWGARTRQRTMVDGLCF